MTFNCPQCNLKLSLSHRRLPAGGAWARCPRCRERFYLPAHKPDLNSQVPALLGGRPGRAVAERELLNRLRARSAATGAAAPDDPGSVWGAVTVFPERALDLAPGFGLLAFLTAGLLGLAAWAWEAAGARPEPPSVAPSPVHGYGGADLRADLEALKLDLAGYAAINRHIDFSGRESRLFNYSLARLAPESCREINALRLWSTRTTDGFQAEGICLENGSPTPLLMVDWRTETTLISLPGSRDFFQVSLGDPVTN